MAFRSILVTLDGSQFGEYALPHAISLARRAAAGLSLVHVRVPPVYLSSADIHLPLPADMEQRATQAAHEYLEDVTQRVQAALPNAEVTSKLLEGPVFESLFDHITSTTPDLLVMCTHGRGSLSRFWLGSVTTEMVQRSSVPLLLVRPGEGPPSFLTDLAPRRILIPLDGSSLGEGIIPLALSVGTLTGAEFRLIRSTTPVMSGAWVGPLTLPVGEQDIAEQLAAQASTYLAAVRSRYPGLSSAKTHVAVDSVPAEAILADAEANGVDLIAMGTHGRSGLAKMLLGSVADKVLRGASIPVLLRRPASD